MFEVYLFIDQNQFFVDFLYRKDIVNLLNKIKTMETYLLNKQTTDNQISFIIWSAWSMNLWTLKDSPLLPQLSTIEIKNDNGKGYWLDVTVPSDEFTAIIETISNICVQLDICLHEAYDQTV